MNIDVNPAEITAYLFIGLMSMLLYFMRNTIETIKDRLDVFDLDKKHVRRTS